MTKIRRSTESKMSTMLYDPLEAQIYGLVYFEDETKILIEELHNKYEEALLSLADIYRETSRDQQLQIAGWRARYGLKGCSDD